MNDTPLDGWILIGIIAACLIASVVIAVIDWWRNRR
jgi:hypothetical protein